MSRFIEALQNIARRLRAINAGTDAQMLARLEASEGEIAIRFPYFITTCAGFRGREPVGLRGHAADRIEGRQGQDGAGSGVR